MLTAQVERYLSLRRALGFKLRDVARDLRAYARYAEARGDACVRLRTAADWAETAPSPMARHVRLRRVAGLARFLRAEDRAHEVPPASVFHVPARRPLPHIYTPEQLARIVAAAGRLRESYKLRRRTYGTLFGLIAATGLRISEALGLRLGDVLPGGVLRIERTKFGKSRLVPLHPTAEEALGRYLDERRQLAEADDHVFLSAGRRRIGLSMADYTFRRVLQIAGVASGRERACRIHDLRHTFASFGAAANLSLPIIGKMLGHREAATTQRYAHLAADPVAQAAEAVSQAVAAAMGGGNSDHPVR
jgi:site-specific recombinase XerD